MGKHSRDSDVISSVCTSYPEMNGTALPPKRQIIGVNCIAKQNKIDTCLGYIYKDLSLYGAEILIAMEDLLSVFL